MLQRIVRSNTLRLLPLALAVLLAATPAFASDPVGRVVATVTDADGALMPGVQVKLVNQATGVERTAFADGQGEVRLPQLPVGAYTLTATLDSFQTYEREVRVSLGQTSVLEIEMVIGAVTDTVVVTDAAPLVDTTSTTSGLTVNTSELTERVPVVRETTAVALLAPATTDGDRAFDGETPGQNLASVGGSSVAENTYIVNGMNITNFRNGLGANQVPFEMVQEVQVKTGGYPAEFGWATGGVINVVTKSGTNEYHGGANIFHQPESLQEASPNTVFRTNETEEREQTSANVFLGGPIYKDRAFFFGLYEHRDSIRDDFRTTQAFVNSQDEPFYGGKFDVNLSSNQRVEATYFQDETTVESDSFGFDPVGGVGSLGGSAFADRGGESYTGRYTGIFGDSFVLAAQYGHNEFARTSQSTTDQNPVIVESRGGAFDFLGNWSSFTVAEAADERDMYRLDADYFLSRHSLRAGVTYEENIAFDATDYSGGHYYRYYDAAADGSLPGVPGSAGTVAPGAALVRDRVFEGGGEFETLNEAYYLQDNWEVNDSFQLNAGLRLEQFNNKNASGESFIEVTDQYGPRLGAIWDAAGDGRSKIYANVGRYFLPIAANTNIRLAGAENFTEDWYSLNGLNADESPVLGDLLLQRVFSDGTIPDVRETRSEEIDPFYQDELVFGYERLVGDNWSLGARGVYRTVGEIIEDITINQTVATRIGLDAGNPADLALLGADHYVLVNPGNGIVTFWDILGPNGEIGQSDGILERWEFSAEELGFPEAEREYLAVELTFNRRFADSWSLQGSYAWAHSYGNYEGWVRSDNGQDDAGITSLFDFPGMLDGARGNLPNDRRHNVKLFGAYRFDNGLLLGANATYRTGRPLNAFGIHPTDVGAASFGPEAFYRNGELVPRGSVGTTDDLTQLDLTGRYDFELGATDLSLRFDVFNAFDDDTVVEVVETAETASGAADQNYLEPTSFQRPRTVRLGLAITF
ncbi:MAG: TonB-dependent receptor [Acidobacteriota bacterium]